jgi:hypothetical protein
MQEKVFLTCAEAAVATPNEARERLGLVRRW